MKKSALMIGVACLLFIGTFGVSFAAPWWHAEDMTIVSVQSGTRFGVQLYVTYTGQATPKMYMLDYVTPPANRNEILAVALTAASTGKLVNLEFEFGRITGIRLIN